MASAYDWRSQGVQPMTLTRPARFDIPGVSPDWQNTIEEAFQSVFPNDIPKPVAPEKESEK
jgi:hypothetical protein